LSAYQDNYDLIKWAKPSGVKKIAVRYDSCRSDFEMPYISCDYKSYECPITGDIIDGKKEHLANLEKHGCRVHEKGEFEDVKKNGKKELDAELDAAIDKSVDAVAQQIDF
jgi:hypothetical protein|tara:strand:- start:4058 stop:4387 length:330 start_codon:yes stop_codon:yes gene_type:complete